MNKKFKAGLFTLAVAAAVIFSISSGFSQGWGRGYGHTGPGYGYGHMMEPGYGHMMGPGYGGYDNFKSELGLTEKQIEKIHKINSRYREKFFQNRNNPEKFYTLRQEQQKEISNVLTKDQKDKFFGSRGYGRGYGYRGCGW